MSFPLYDNLLKEIPKKDLTVKQKNEFITNISKMDQSGYELVYALIHNHELKSELSNSNSSLPYEGKLIKKDTIEFDFNIFPLELKHILYKFSKIHIKTMEENKVLEEKRETTV